MVGPLQVWNSWPGAEFQFVAQNVGPVPTDSALSVNATHNFEQAWTAPDILFVPGGTEGTFELLGNEEVMAFLAKQGAKADWITSVCSGSVVLAAAGLLAGYRATSHWMARDFLPAFGVEVGEGRWVIDRNRASGGGVTAGIDFGLAMVAHISGDDNMARAIQLTLEYSPKPPFVSGHPDEADPNILSMVVDNFNANGAERREELMIQAVARYESTKSTIKSV